MNDDRGFRFARRIAIRASALAEIVAGEAQTSRELIGIDEILGYIRATSELIYLQQHTCRARP